MLNNQSRKYKSSLAIVYLSGDFFSVVGYFACIDARFLHEFRHALTVLFKQVIVGTTQQHSHNSSQTHEHNELTKTNDLHNMVMEMLCIVHMLRFISTITQYKNCLFWQKFQTWNEKTKLFIIRSIWMFYVCWIFCCHYYFYWSHCHLYK